jgi:hypothetical protein
MDLSMNSYEEVYQNIMNNIRNNIINYNGVNNDNFGQNALFGQNIQLNQGSFQNILQSSLNQKNKYIKVLSEKGKNSIKYVNFNKNKHDETFCPICQDDFEESQIVAMLPCNHIFEKISIIQWLTEESHKCPVCRYEMDYIEKNDENVTDFTSNEEDISNNTVNYSNRVLSFLELINERREELNIQRAIEESLKIIGEEESEKINDYSDGMGEFPSDDLYNSDIESVD